MASKGIIATGDQHLKPQTWGNRPELRGDAERAFNSIVDLCIAGEYDLLLMGDAFNANHPDSQSVVAFRQGIARLHAAGAKVWAIQGQHDAAIPPWPVAVADTIDYVHGKTFRPFGKEGPVFYALDCNKNSAALDEACHAVPKEASVFVGHQLAETAFPLEGVWNFSIDWLPDNIRLVLLGDYHKAVDYDVRGRHLYYSGSTYMCSITEDSDKSVLRLVLNVKGQIEVDRVPIPSRPCERVQVFTAAELTAAEARLQQLVASVKPDQPMPLFHVTYTPNVEKVVERLSMLAGSKVYLWPSPKAMRFQEDEAEGKPMEYTGEKPTLDGCLRSVASGQAYRLAADLLQGDADVVLANARKSFGL